MARVELRLRPKVSAQRRSLPLLASRLRWILAAGMVLASVPLLGALTTSGARGPVAKAPAAIGQIANQASNILSPTSYEITMPLQVVQVTPPPPPPPPPPLIAAAAAARSAYGNGFWQPVAEPAVGTIKQIIWAAAQKYNVSYGWLLSVAQCESGLDPVDVNRSSGASGLFQFMPATFAGHGGTDIWNPTQQANIAAKMFSIGESGEWVCK
ncbi:MAG: transglycosylase SLT domain-containing protein [Candidatus Dormibacteria bacterium]